MNKQSNKKRRKPLINLPKNKNGSPNRTRTCDNTVNSRVLYQLSYQGTLHLVNS